MLVGAARRDPANPHNRELLGRLGAPALGFGALFLGKFLIARLAIDSLAVEGQATRSVLILGGIVLLGVVAMAIRLRGFRHLPPDVRAVLGADHRNHALLWVLAFGGAAVVLGLFQLAVGWDGAAGLSWFGLALVAVGVLAAATTWRLWRGARRSPFSRRSAS